jgi:hypothetical protein
MAIIFGTATKFPLPSCSKKLVNVAVEPPNAVGAKKTLPKTFTPFLCAAFTHGEEGN